MNDSGPFIGDYTACRHSNTPLDTTLKSFTKSTRVNITIRSANSAQFRVSLVDRENRVKRACSATAMAGGRAGGRAAGRLEATGRARARHLSGRWKPRPRICQALLICITGPTHHFRFVLGDGEEQLAGPFITTPPPRREDLIHCDWHVIALSFSLSLFLS